VRRWLWYLTAACALAQTPPAPTQPPGQPDQLSLQDAEALAVRNHPQISAALLNAAAANQVTIETHAASLPTFYGSVTAAGAIHNSSLTVGNLNSSSVFNRIASGVTASQLITDFGRTSSLTTSARGVSGAWRRPPTSSSSSAKAASPRPRSSR